jgi:hypothetical protein
MPVSERQRSYAVQIFNKAKKLISSNPAEISASSRRRPQEQQSMNATPSHLLARRSWLAKSFIP